VQNLPEETFPAGRASRRYKVKLVIFVGAGTAWG